MTAAPAAPYGVRAWSVWTTTARVATSDPAALDEAVGCVQTVLHEVDDAANRFRPDSEISRLNASTGTAAAKLSPVLCALLRAALNAAAATDGLVDPTVASALDDLGYDRTITAVFDSHGGAIPTQVRRPVGWRHITLDESRCTVHLPRGCRLDLGATAKAWAADTAASIAADRTGTGVLVSLGGDLAVAGPPPGDGWLVTVADDHARPRADDPQVLVRCGGLATSSTTTRTWARAGKQLHHIIDPRTAQPSDGPWRTVSVAAGSCVDANTAATSAIIAGEAALRWLTDLNLPARLVGRGGQIHTVSGWPAVASQVAS